MAFIKAIFLASAAVSLLLVAAVQPASAATINHPAALHHRLQHFHAGGAGVYNRAHEHEAQPRLHHRRVYNRAHEHEAQPRLHHARG